MASNRKVGNDFESDLCEIFAEHGFWVHNFAQKIAGQPADVIAVRNGKAYLIDCKFCSNNRFPFSRVEENQQWSMTVWKNCKNGEGWFALSLKDGRVYMLYHSLVIALSLHQSSLNEELITHYGIPLEQWIFDH